VAVGRRGASGAAAYRGADGRLLGLREVAYDEIGRAHHEDRVELDPAGAPTGRRFRTSRTFDPACGRVVELTQGITGPGQPSELCRGAGLREWHP